MPMSRAQVRRRVAGLTTVSVFLLVGLALHPSQEGASGPGGKPRPPRPAGKPVAMAANLAGLTVRLGLKDAKPTDWDGEVRLSEGRVLSMAIVQGNVKGTVRGDRFTVRSVFKMKAGKKKDTFLRPILNITL